MRNTFYDSKVNINFQLRNGNNKTSKEVYESQNNLSKEGQLLKIFDKTSFNKSLYPELFDKKSDTTNDGCLKSLNIDIKDLEYQLTELT